MVVPVCDITVVSFMNFRKTVVSSGGWTHKWGGGFKAFSHLFLTLFLSDYKYYYFNKLN